MKALLFFAVVIIAITWVNKKLNKEVSKMNTQSQQIKSDKINTEHVTHNTIHDVFIANTHLIGDKLLSILAYIIGEEDEHGLYSIVFTENYPQRVDGSPVTSRFYADSRCLLVNLQCHLEMAKLRMKQPTSRVHFWHYCWKQLLMSLYHEIRHAEKYLDADSIYDVDTSDPKWEADAEEYASDMLIELAKSIDIEPPDPQDFPYFADQVIQIAQDICNADPSEDWQDLQGYAIVSNLCYFDPGVDGKTKPVEIPTLREYIKRLADDDDKRWGKPVGTMAEIAEAIKVKPNPEPGTVITGMHNGEVVTGKVAEPQQQELFKPEPKEPESTVAVDESGTEMATFTPQPGDDVRNAMHAIVDEQVKNEFVDNTLPDEGCPFDPFDGMEEEMELEGMIDHAMTEGRMALPTDADWEATLNKNPHLKKYLPTPAAPETGSVSLNLNLNPGPGNEDKPKPAMKQLEPHNLTGPQMNGILHQVLMRLYAHIFQKCGWNWKGGFTNMEAIHQPVYIGDIPGANQLFHSYEVTENKVSVEKRIDDTIVGRYMPKANIPGYHLYLNINGMKYKRAFMPQNPNKTKANSQELTAWAARAQAGEMIGMLSETGKGVRVSIITPVGGETDYKNPAF